MVRMTTHTIEDASFDLLLKSGALDEALDVLEKSYGAERPGHKYTSRRRKPDGSWEYKYATDQAREHAQMAFTFAAKHGTDEQKDRAVEVLKRTAPDVWQDHVHAANVAAEAAAPAHVAPAHVPATPSMVTPEAPAASTFKSHADGSGAEEMVTLGSGVKVALSYVAGKVTARRVGGASEGMDPRAWRMKHGKDDAAITRAVADFEKKIAALGPEWNAAHRAMYELAPEDNFDKWQREQGKPATELIEGHEVLRRPADEAPALVVAPKPEPTPLVVAPVETAAPFVPSAAEEASMKEDDRKRVSPDNFDTMPDDDGISPAVRKQRAARLAERNATRDANAHGAHAAAVFEQKRVASMEPEEIKDPSARATKIRENQAKRDAEAAMQAGAERLTGDERHEALTRMGQHLHDIQDFKAGKDDTGMSGADMQVWARARTPARKAMLLRKYRRQLVEQLGDLYFKAGLHEKEPVPKGHVPASGEWTKRGGLIVKVDGFLGQKFAQWKSLLKQHGFQWNGQRGEDSADGMHADKAAALDVAGFIEAANNLGIHVEIPEKPEIAPEAPAAANEPEPEPVAPAADRPVSSDETTRAINDIRGRRARNTVALTVRDDGQYAFYAADFRKKDVPGSFWHTMSSQNGAISGLMDVNASDWSVNTYSADLATEALDKLKAANPTFHFFVDPKATAAVAKAAADKTEAEKPIPAVEALLADGFALKPYQNAMVRFLDSNDGNAIVGDEMGLGKTLQSLAWVAKGGKKAVVVVPKVVRRTWIEEAHKFFPGHFDAKELRSKDLKKHGMPDLTGKNLVTINYESLEKFMPALKAAGFDTIIVDESHRAKNPKAKTTKVIQTLAAGMKHRILMSGTAVKNGKEELFTQLEMVKPGLWSSAKELQMSTHGKAWSKMREHYLARSKKNVLKDLPEKTTTISTLYAPGAPDVGERKEPKPPPPGANERQIAAYEKAALEWEEQKEAEIDDDSFEDEIDAEYAAGRRSRKGERGGATSIGEYSKVRGQLALAKVDATVDMVKEILDSSDSKVLVFTESVAAAKAIHAALGAEAILHFGGQSDDKREAAKREFQDPSTTKRVFVSTRPSLAVGATLTAADKVVFNDLPWTAADVRQAEDRCHRVGQKNAVNVYWNVAEDNNFDENVAAILRRKYDLSKKINEGAQLSPEEKAWMDKPVSMAEVMARIKGKPTEPAETPIKKSARAELRDMTRALAKAAR